MPSTGLHGYWLGAADGGIFSYGVPFFGSQSGTALSQPIAGMAAVPGGTGGYNLADGNGMVFGDGPRATDCTNVSGPLNQSIVGIAAAPGGNGCWLAGSGGEVFPMGSNAPFFGSAGGIKLAKPIVGIGATPNNDGYDLVASDGGLFTYGPGAAFYGSMGGKTLNQPVVGIAIDPTTGGYWEVASDGGVFAFNAPFLGSMGGKPLNKPIVGIAAAPTGDGYYLVASDGGIFAFGPGAHFQGSTGSIKLNQARRRDVPGLVLRTASREPLFVRERQRGVRQAAGREERTQPSTRSTLDAPSRTPTAANGTPIFRSERRRRLNAVTPSPTPVRDSTKTARNRRRARDRVRSSPLVSLNSAMNPITEAPAAAIARLVASGVPSVGGDSATAPLLGS